MLFVYYRRDIKLSILIAQLVEHEHWICLNLFSEIAEFAGLDSVQDNFVSKSPLSTQSEMGDLKGVALMCWYPGRYIPIFGLLTE